MARQTKERAKETVGDTLIRRLLLDSPLHHNRDSLLNSVCKKRADTSPPTLKRDSARKSLGRMISQQNAELGALVERIDVNGGDPRINLPETSMVCISVNTTTLREEQYLRKMYDPIPLSEECPDKGPFLKDEIKPTQSGVVRQLIWDTREWIEEKIGESNQIPIAISRVDIVHGSKDFDICIRIRSVSESALLEFVRSVVQNVPHIKGTQTMFLSSVTWETSDFS